VPRVDGIRNTTTTLLLLCTTHGLYWSSTYTIHTVFTDEQFCCINEKTKLRGLLYLRGMIVVSVAPVNLAYGTVRRGRFRRAWLTIHVINDEGGVYIVYMLHCGEHYVS
jgi:hypothetical protein